MNKKIKKIKGWAVIRRKDGKLQHAERKRDFCLICAAMTNGDIVPCEIIIKSKVVKYMKKTTKKDKIKKLEERMDELYSIICDAECAEFEIIELQKKYKRLTGKEYY